MNTNSLLLALTFMVVLSFATRSYAQQEVDQTWYNPWPEASKVAAQPTSQPVATHMNLPKTTSAVLNQHPEKSRAITSVNARRSYNRPQPALPAATEARDLGMPTKGDL
jgi:hypothetical protein